MIFLFYVLVVVEVLDVEVIVIGINVVDYLGYFDCCFEFIEVFVNMVCFVIKVGVEGKFFKFEIFLLYLFKVNIICLGIEYGVDYS